MAPDVDALAQAFAREMVVELRGLRESVDRLTKAVLLDAQVKLVAPTARRDGPGLLGVASQIAELLRNIRL